MGRILTPDQKWARRVDKLQRARTEWEQRAARTEQLREAVSAMARRWVSSARSEEGALGMSNGMWAGKPKNHWKRAADRQHMAMLRLLHAMQDQADARDPRP